MATGYQCNSYEKLFFFLTKNHIFNHNFPPSNLFLYIFDIFPSKIKMATGYQFYPYRKHKKHIFLSKNSLKLLWKAIFSHHRVKSHLLPPPLTTQITTATHNRKTDKTYHPQHQHQRSLITTQHNVLFMYESIIHCVRRLSLLFFRELCACGACCAPYYYVNVNNVLFNSGNCAQTFNKEHRVWYITHD